MLASMMLVGPLSLFAVPPAIDAVRKWMAPEQADVSDTSQQQRVFTSEEFRKTLDEWEECWNNDCPNHQTPFRTHGGKI